MDTSIKRLLEIAGVDITNDKAKQLIESSEVSDADLKKYTDRLEQLTQTKRNTIKKLMAQGMSGGDADRQASKEYGPEYNKLVKEMTPAHNKHTRAEQEMYWKNSKEKSN